MRLQLDGFSLLKVHISDYDFGTFFEEKIVHHPNRDMDHTFFGRKLKNTTEGLLAELRVLDHEGHGIRDVKTPEFGKS